jgi:hypothetical protein
MTKHTTTTASAAASAIMASASGRSPVSSSHSDFQQIERAPIVPEAVLKRHNAYCATDPRYRAAARLQQALWLKANNILTAADDHPDAGSYLGSKLNVQAARAGLNFSPDIHQLALNEWMFCEPDAAIDPERLFSHSLSSMPLCFALIGPMRLNPELGTAVFRILFPDFVHTVERVVFEHAPGARKRECPLWLGDRSAVDFAVRVTTPKNELGVIYGEIKLTESPTTASRMRDRYGEASRQVRLYRDPDSTILRTAGVDQLWRYHMTAQLAVENKITSRALFTTITPQLNRDMQTVIQAYEAELLDADQREPDRVAFAPLTLETFIRAIAQAGAHDLAQALWGRYCDLGPVIRQVRQEYASDDITLPNVEGALPAAQRTPSSTPDPKPLRPSRRARTKSSVKDLKSHLGDTSDEAVAS